MRQSRRDSYSVRAGHIAGSHCYVGLAAIRALLRAAGRRGAAGRRRNRPAGSPFSKPRRGGKARWHWPRPRCCAQKARRRPTGSFRIPLGGPEGYLRYLQIQALAETRASLIYVPTEAGLPVTEARRLQEQN